MDGFQELRQNAIRACREAGVRLSHRPEGVKFDEGRALIMPDMGIDVGSDFRVRDCVRVKREAMVPWSPTLLPYQVEGFGVKTDLYGENIFQILFFAKVMAEKRRCQLEGLFCVLADWGHLLPLRQPILVCDRVHKVLLHWVGCLIRPEETISLPR